MKRVLTFLAILLLPLSVWAMTPITDTQLSDVTGQAGVSFNFDFTLDLQFGQLGWGDSNGLGPANGNVGGWVGIDSLHMTALHIWPRTDFSMDNTSGFGVNLGGGADEGDWRQLKYLTIDVATLPSASLGNPFGAWSIYNPLSHPSWRGVTAVVIGIPTLTMTMDAMDGNVVLGPRASSQSVGGQIQGVYKYAKDVQGPQFNQLLGQFYVGGMNIATGGGSVYIFAHGLGSTTGAVSSSVLYGSGVTMSLNSVTISYILFDALSWGDIDGVYATGTATSGNTLGNATWGLMQPGWIGLKDVGIKNLVINGVMVIDVWSVVPGGLAPFNTMDLISSVDETNLTFQDLTGAFDDIFLTTPPNPAWTGGFSAASIGFINGFNISMGAFGAKVNLGNNKSFATSTSSPLQELGDIYVGGMSMTIIDNPAAGCPSKIQIFAH